MSRRDLIRRLSALGFTGPRAGSTHEFMQRDLNDILKEAGISRDEWEQAR